MRFGVTVGLLHPALWRDFAVEADRLGFESVWMPEHLVFTEDMGASQYPGGRAPVSPDAQLFDTPAFLCAIAESTAHIKLATYVYLFALRHPFVAARAFATLDVLSGGRAIVGVGAGWLKSEWDAVGLDFASRGKRLDEALAVAKRLWTEPVVSHEGRFFAFSGVHFEPKPVRKPHPPILAGGTSVAAMRRAARLCDGWVGMPGTLETLRPQLAQLRRVLDEEGRDPSTFDITVSAFETTGPAEIDAWQELGVDRIVVRPQKRTGTALDDLRAFAAEYAVGRSSAPAQVHAPASALADKESPRS